MNDRLYYDILGQPTLFCLFLTPTVRKARTICVHELGGGHKGV